ncbi:hypothetical protein [Pseudovibrio sp. Alg231-02]|uniref:hypothetical protein n=1 Tax=Pseudovibrio sp. Alg231-02 TaxID=1922223 RepID=UPI00131F2FFD|nr:hypothetical protein [Pseudovibrio sp. Alg231-02]
MLSRIEYPELTDEEFVICLENTPKTSALELAANAQTWLTEALGDGNTHPASWVTGQMEQVQKLQKDCWKAQTELVSHLRLLFPALLDPAEDGETVEFAPELVKEILLNRKTREAA